MGLEFPIEQSQSMGVKLGDGNSVNTMGKAKKVEVPFENFTTLVDTHVLEQGDLDMILGVTWLRKEQQIATQAGSLQSLLRGELIARDTGPELGLDQ